MAAKFPVKAMSSNLISQISFSRLPHFNQETIGKNFGSSTNDGEEKSNKREKHPETEIIIKTEDLTVATALLEVLKDSTMNSDALLSRTTRYVLDRFDCGGDKGLKDERMPNGAYDPLLRDNSDASDVIATDITGIPVVLLLVIVLMVDSLT
ncbi:hypothetical protein HZH68_011213 [Vespula germanica]|uniref:Uncharacterized protein n=2 Tax=Vespula TaxID=7451 RepID=A0A834N0V0_VESGE|nr:hypothetical protein HZH68_011213 [Vespula germanica]